MPDPAGPARAPRSLAARVARPHLAGVIITPIPVLADNYVWLLAEPSRHAALVVDPGDAAPVVDQLRQQGLTPAAILLTHHHGDHVGGVLGLTRQWPGLEVVASAIDGARIEGVTRLVEDGERLELLGVEVRCLLVPGHTRGAVAYHLPAPGAVFTGDTLFTSGCGRLFEGTPPTMLASLRRLSALPPDTLVYCGHEYSESNLRFATHLLPADAALTRRLAETLARRARGEPTVPERLSVELATNPFLRWDDPALRAAVETDDALATFTEVRRRRDHFRA
jgi:hydroxyacylglutathione hydrolase